MWFPDLTLTECFVPTIGKKVSVSFWDTTSHALLARREVLNVGAYRCRYLKGLYSGF
jgi:hypothetical protein